MAEPVPGMAQPRLADDLAPLYLPAAALLVVVGVLALAVRPDRTAVVDVVAQLAHVLDHHVHAVRVALAQVPAAGVVGALAAEPDGAVADVLAAFALLAEAVVLELQHGREGEGVVGAGDIDVLGPDAGVGPQDLARIPCRPPSRSARAGSACRCAACTRGPATPRIRTLGWRRSLARSALVTMMAVALSVSTQQSSRCSGLQMMRLASTSSTRHALLVVGLRVVGGVLAVRRPHGRHLRRRGAVVVHVAHEGRAEHLSGALPAIGAAVQHVARDRHGRARARAADAHLGEAVHGTEDGDGLAHAGLDHADGDADQRLGRRAAAEHVHVEVEADAEVAGYERGRRCESPDW